MQRNSLKYKIWIYLIIFSVSILSFLWLFQVIFLDSYYTWFKTKTIKKIKNQVITSYKQKDFDQLDKIAFETNTCIEIDDIYGIIYTTGILNKGCFSKMFINSKENYKHQFMTSNLKEEIYELKNPYLDNRNLIYAIKDNSYHYIFLATSLEAIDATSIILKNQLIYVTILVLALSFLIAYFISRKISTPIININNAAKKLAKGKFDISFTTNNDIEEINELAITLNYAKDELSKTENLRNELLANISHDLKTPLTMIKAYAEMVRDLTYKNKQKREENLNIIINETDRLNQLVNDILDLSKLKALSKLNYETCNLNDLINSIIKHYEIYKLKDNYNIIYQNKSTKPLVTIDIKCITQVLYNLINNAINYTGDDKKIIINLTELNNYYRISVSDTGKGISNQDLKYIWDKYYKSDKTHSRLYLGTGLGLSIVKNILENHHFKYGVNSKKNQGTTFYFEIPKN